MNRLGLHPHDFRLYKTAITLPHLRRIDLSVLNLDDGSHRSSLTPDVIDGQLAVDVTADVSRMLDIHFVDERARLGFEPNDPSAAPLHRSRMMRITDSRYIESLGDWIEAEVFTGPIIDFQREGGDVNVTCHGMEAQAMGAAWETIHCPAKSKITDAVRKLLAAAGDVNAVVPDLPHTFPKDHVVHPLDPIWPHVRRMVASLDYYALYDGSGRFRMRPHTQRAVDTFRDALTSQVTVKRQTDGFVNTIVVLGPKPHGPKAHRVRGVATLKGSLSPEALSRHGVPFHAVESDQKDFTVTHKKRTKGGKVKKVTHDMPHLQANKQAQSIAERLLLEHATTATELSFDAMPDPTLEEYDMVAVTDDTFGSTKMRMRTWNLPIEGGESGTSDGANMSVGSIRRTTRAKVRTR